jgi:hypothetical protein
MNLSLPEETQASQTVPVRPQWTTTPMPLPEQLTAHQEEQWRALQDNIKREAIQQRGELIDERTAVEARLADLHQRELALEAGRTVAVKPAELQLPSFASASQNVATMAMRLDTLPAPSSNGVGKVYQ